MIELTLPEFDTAGKSTKDLVITLLLRHHPLNVKQVWYKIRRTFGKNISYQAVYKSVSELMETGVLVKNEIGYEISLQWIGKVKRFTQNLEDTYGKTDYAEVPSTIIT